MIKIAICPICEKQTELSQSNFYRPFCCKRCKLIDLGQWIKGSYSITGSVPDEDEFDMDSKQKP